MVEQDNKHEHSENEDCDCEEEHDHSEHAEHDHDHAEHDHDEHAGHSHAADEECDCDEDHDHIAHDHDHDGHDHSAHDHDHDGHDHDHQLANGEVEVNLHEEGALIASGSLTLAGVNTEDISSRLAAAMTQVAVNVDNAGGMIGHLKATISSTSVRMLSTTASETEVSIRLSPQSQVLVNMVLIVFLVEQDDLLKWGQEVMAALQ
ncbi:MAG: hypothetical protein FWD45_03015 [Coriobacteriia bacterium]|nr:hypothetical protein [Coriobacteriia bacterium]